MRPKLRRIGGTLGALAVSAALLAVTSFPTTAAWNDDVYTAAEFSAGTWVTTTTTIPTTTTTTPPKFDAITCYPVDKDVKATCSVKVTVWDFWGQGYRTALGISSASDASFHWEIRYDLSAQYIGYPPGPLGPLFPGDPVPKGGWWDEWPIAGADSTNACVVSGPDELPIVRVRGLSWNQSVGGGVVVPSNVELQARMGREGVTGPACPKA